MRKWVMIAGLILGEYLAWGLGFQSGYASGKAAGYTEGWTGANLRRVEMDRADERNLKEHGFCHYAVLLCDSAELRR